MGLHLSLFHIEQEAYKDSFIHNLDGRTKIIITLMAIIYAVYSSNIFILLFLELCLFFLIFLSKINIFYVVTRILIILPFGGTIALFQLFIQKGEVLCSLAYGVEITHEGIIFGILLAMRMIVCVTSITLLSSTTPMHELVSSARKLRVPKKFILLLSLLARYLFVFYSVFQRMRMAQKTRCFNLKGKPRRWVLEQVGCMIGTMFLRAYEQGEKVYLGMLSRGFNPDSQMYVVEKKFNVCDAVMIVIFFLLLTFLELYKHLF